MQKALLLLDAHVFQKLNDYQALTTSMLNFIRAAYKDLPTVLIIKCALQVFYQSAFSFKIFNYKQAHSGVLF